MFEPNTPSLISRSDFEHNAFNLFDMISKGRLSINIDMEEGNKSRISKELMAVRRLPNGRIDLHTINEGARCMMNSAQMMLRHQNELDRKSVV